jgi:hypothetical protein
MEPEKQPEGWARGARCPLGQVRLNSMNQGKLQDEIGWSERLAHRITAWVGSS